MFFDSREATPNMKITQLLHLMVEKNASDLYLTTGAPVSLKIKGRLRPAQEDKLQVGWTRKIAEEVLTRSELETFFAQREMNKGLALKGIGRFRMNLYFQRGEVSMVVRHIRSEIAEPEALGIPEILQDLVMGKEGLVLFVGSTGSGKSTTMASLVQHRNENHTGHILTIEDPIEYTFKHNQSIIGQREVGFDTLSYANAMREAMREAPDMIMVGEVRDYETMHAVLGFADTGHLVLSSLHATTVAQALERILYLFPREESSRVLMDLSLNLKAIVAQRLVPTGFGESEQVHLASEVLINTPYVSELIRKGDFSGLRELMERGGSDGMQSFDQSLFELFKAKKISRSRALEFATSRNNLEWQMNFGDHRSKTVTEDIAKALDEDPLLEMSSLEDF